ncbi:tyrosine aminotransferase [Strigomonas culicis]|uniref:Tyrosine aminotransferase n=1 Tax=Strigomonas culicis TaxID=28005 RepID=S9TQV7_9TRYP|nr:tyrosine aminotransferase [Strigomonas culicis]|eukprot:EPY19004.1 tyrosine aminotransferase [Strigomonas culicis]
MTEARKASVLAANVLITSGGSHAIVLAITAVCNEGDNLLLTAPAFPHYKAVCDSYGIECRYVPMLADQHWQVDLDVAEQLVDDRTRVLCMINPSNPCGSNWSRSHVTDIVRFCERRHVPIIADEIYSELVFKGEVFTSVADIDTPVPRVILGGGAKHVAVPGWRIGWLCLVDPAATATAWMRGMDRLAQLHTGANSVCQEAFTKALLRTPQAHIDNLTDQLQRGAAVYNRLLEHDIGLSFDPPRASMFIMIKVECDRLRDIESDMQFYERLLDEENVQLMPGMIFGMDGFLRATISRPPAVLNEAVDRIIAFCERHRRSRGGGGGPFRAAGSIPVTVVRGQGEGGGCSKERISAVLSVPFCPSLSISL